MSTLKPPQTAKGLDLPQTFHVAPARLHHDLLIAAFLAVTGLAVLWLAPASLPGAEWLAVINLGLAATVTLTVLLTARDCRPGLVVGAEGVW